MTIREAEISPPKQHTKNSTETDPLLPSPATNLQTSGPTVNDDRAEQRSHLYGYILMALSSLAFSTMTFCVHIATRRYGLSPQTCFFIRGTVQTLLSYVYMHWFLDIRHMVGSFTTHHWKMLSFRGVIGGIGMISLYTALKLLPVGEAMTIFFFGPVITMLLSSVVLGEVITKIDGIASIISFTGILLVVRPGVDTQVVNDGHRFLGALCAVSGAFLSAVAYITVRYLASSVHFITNVFSLGFASLLISTLLGGAVGPNIFFENRVGFLYILLSSVSAFIAQCFLSAALKHCPVGPGILVRNLDVPLAYIAGLLFLGEKPSWPSLLGSVLVLTGTLLVGIRKMM